MQTNMFDFSEDEMVFMLIAILAGGWGIVRWTLVVLNHAPPVNRMRSGLAILPGVCLAIVAAIIWNWADPAQVSGHIDYLLLFLAGAAAWFWLTVGAVAALGIHFRYDAVEAGNRAAAISIAGAGLATSLIYAGGNIGGGPTIWTTILPAAAASLALGVLWFIVDASAHVGDAVTIDRDSARRHPNSRLGRCLGDRPRTVRGRRLDRLERNVQGFPQARMAGRSVDGSHDLDAVAPAPFAGTTATQ